MADPDPDPKDPNHFAGSGSEIIVLDPDPDPKCISKCWNYPKCETNFKELVADPDPKDPNHFAGSGSESKRFGSATLIIISVLPYSLKGL